ncbi:MAG: hopanoid biosynthesis-associated protein HpnK [Anaerolineae bacterium]|nr:hopanoid biosynthesis-associated protein HpnK [Anaerolineae bacterium]
MPRLIVNGDDFGAAPAVNAAIAEAFRTGILTSASLMVTGEAVDEAVALARELPGLRVGLHLVLLSGRSCLPPEEVPHLVDTQGCFPENPLAAGVRWMFSAAARRELRREVEAQVTRFQETGLPPDHLNSHRHFHVHPLVFDLLVEAADRLGRPHIRFPAESWRLALAADRRYARQQIGYALVFGLLAAAYRRRRRVVSPGVDGVFGLLRTGTIDETYLIRLLQRLPEGCFELYLHPRLDTMQGRRELAALCSTRVRQVIAERRIVLTTYGDR